jgi:peptidoglycan L-alanyl-D-glutamate endopeptidase CwlK
MNLLMLKGKKMRFLILILLFTVTPLISQENVIVDSNFTLEEALKGVNPDCPEWILNNQAIIEVYYYGFDKKLHKGQLIADYRLSEELHSIFKVAYDMKFPIRHVKPINVYDWDDFKSMEAGNSSAFNYREIPFSQNLSKHAYGWAIDINTRLNPYYTKGKVFPDGAVYDEDKPGTLFNKHPIVTKFKELGWRWGGDWRNKDYQHFDKSLEKTEGKDNKKIYKWPYEIYRFNL